MNVKRELLKRPGLAKNLLRVVPPKVLTAIGRKRAYKTYQKSLKIKAYREFLSHQKVKPQDIKSLSDIPISDKNSYISPNNLTTTSDNSSGFLFYRSSGYSGKPVYWLQNRNEYLEFTTYVEFNLKSVFNAQKKKTLIISMYALSSWITGQQVYNSIHDFALKNENVTIFACGMSIDEAYDIVKTHGDNFEQILILSYPLTFKSLIEKGKKEKFEWRDKNISVIIGAEGIPYNLSAYFNESLTRKPDEEFRVFSAFGAADTGIAIGSEIQSSLIIKRFLFENKKLLKAITGKNKMPLHIFQFNPMDNYIEEVDGEFIITKDKKIPLVRYNLHDEIKVVTVDRMKRTFRDFNLDLKKELTSKNAYLLNLPFILIYGRSDDTIILNGANIYINSFKEALSQKSLVNLHTGKFRVQTYKEEDLFTNYIVEVELSADAKPSEKLKNTFRKEITQFLKENDEGYAAAYHRPYKNREICKIKFTTFTDDTLKHKYSTAE